MLRLSTVLLVVVFASVTSAQTPTPTDSDDRADDTSIRSVDGTGIRSVDGTGVRSVDDGTGTQSVDGTGIQSVDGTGIQSVDGTGVQSRSGSQSYTVKSGDTLGSIARQYYGDSGQWERIYKANMDILSDANLVPVGVVLTIPASE